MIKETLTNLLTERLKEADLSDCFLVEIKELPAKRIEVYLDSDEGINIEKCAKISRFLESYLDNNPILDGKYVLDVSSAGVGRPLQLKRQYIKNIGRRISIKTREGKKLVGLLKKVTNEYIEIEEVIKKETNIHKISFNQIKEAKIKVQF